MYSTSQCFITSPKKKKITYIFTIFHLCISYFSFNPTAEHIGPSAIGVFHSRLPSWRDRNSRRRCPSRHSLRFSPSVKTVGLRNCGEFVCLGARKETFLMLIGKKRNPAGKLTSWGKGSWNLDYLQGVGKHPRWLARFLSHQQHVVLSFRWTQIAEFSHVPEIHGAW